MAFSVRVACRRTRPEISAPAATRVPGATETVRMRPLMGERSSVVCWPSCNFATRPPWRMAVPILSVSVTVPEAGAEIFAGCKRATICARPEESPKRTSESAAFPRTIGEGSFNIFRRDSYHFRIPARRLRVAAPHALTQLHKRMLDVARMLFVVEEFGDLLVCEAAAEPSVPPEQKGH